MQSKGAKKSLRVKLPSTTLEQRKYDKDSPGAMNMNYFIMVTNKEGEEKKAKIIECRLDRDVFGERTLEEVREDPLVQLRESSYEYYVHYDHMNRRLDEWAKYSQIKTTQEFIDEKKIKTENKKLCVIHSSDEEYEGLDKNARRDHEEATKVKTITRIKFGEYTAETWYYSPYPDGYHNIDCLYYCEFCLSFYVDEGELRNHMELCTLVHPPGNQIYKDDERKLAMFEVDGYKNPTYCENLCYLAKLFLDHKFLLYTIVPFLFYILCTKDENGYHIVGYFSKNKDFAEGYNLSCILTLPFHQRKGYGKFLINMSYELSKIEKRVGTPEKPLSDLGKQSYLSFWTQKIIEYIQVLNGSAFNIQDIIDNTAIREVDIIDAMERVNLIKKVKNEIYFCTDKKILGEIYKKMGQEAIPVNTQNLIWFPFNFKYEVQENKEQVRIPL